MTSLSLHASDEDDIVVHVRLNAALLLLCAQRVCPIVVPGETQIAGDVISGSENNDIVTQMVVKFQLLLFSLSPHLLESVCQLEHLR